MSRTREAGSSAARFCLLALEPNCRTIAVPWLPGYINLGRMEDLGPAASERSVEAMRGRAWEVLDEAWRQGVRYFEPWRRRRFGWEEAGEVLKS